ncbi:MAG TPA: hypothetical protein VKT72_08130 [Candidatus Baltobacteraceae bacterium]|nr:hypothetical protein [Candidatus Baltobacteraceae bacterium]
MPYDLAYHVALDGNGLNGLEGLAGVCLFRYDSASDAYAFKIVYYEGVAAGHAVMINPAGTIGYLGNAGQHLLFYDARTLEERARISTLRFEQSDSTLRGSTHLVWLDDWSVLTPVGAYFYRFDVRNLRKGERVAEHSVKIPHGMKRSASGRYVLYGAMDHPTLGEAREVGIFDLKTGAVRRVPMPTTCWHVIPHPRDDRFYAVSFRVHPDERGSYHEWAIAYFKEYAYEIDARSGEIVRHWSAGRQIPAHINSDMAISQKELIFCNGASHSIVFIDLASFAAFRLIDERPGPEILMTKTRELQSQITEVFARQSFFQSTHRYAAAYIVSRGAVLDSIYGCQLSSNERLLFTANRGLNHITIYNYPENTVRLRVDMPPIQNFCPWLQLSDDPRLGFHHSALLDERRGASATARSRQGTAARPARAAESSEESHRRPKIRRRK